MGWTLAGVTVHVYKDSPVRESLYAQQNVLDATSDTITYFGAKSIHRRIQFHLLPETSGTSAKDTLDTAVTANSDVALVSDQGAEGNYRILSFSVDRVTDISRSNPVWDCSADLLRTS